MKDYNKLINKLLRISEDMHWELLTEAAMAIRELQVDAARYRFIRKECVFNPRYVSVAIPSVYSWETVRIPAELDQAIDAAMKGTE